MKKPREHALALLDKAGHDLVAARATIATGEALDTVCFHAQQAAEKSLKALLALNDIVYPHRHDLGELVELAKVHFPALSSLEPEIIALSPYAVELRDHDSMNPSLAEARAALDTATRSFAFAEKIIPR